MKQALGTTLLYLATTAAFAGNLVINWPGAVDPVTGAVTTESKSVEIRGVAFTNSHRLNSRQLRLTVDGRDVFIEAYGSVGLACIVQAQQLGLLEKIETAKDQLSANGASQSSLRDIGNIFTGQRNVDLDDVTLTFKGVEPLKAPSMFDRYDDVCAALERSKQVNGAHASEGDERRPPGDPWDPLTH